tara:strand:- start:31 stop:429 length:399 start_codon:yes stop_codon:yes gene_type:complete
MNYISDKWNKVAKEGNFSSPCTSTLYGLAFDAGPLHPSMFTELIEEFTAVSEEVRDNHFAPEVKRRDYRGPTHDSGIFECLDFGMCAQIAADEKRAEEEEAFGYISEEHDRSAARSERLQDHLDEIDYECGG